MIINLACNISENAIDLNIQEIDNIYFNSVFNTDAEIQFVNDKNPNEWLKFTINRPSDESIVETKIYF